MQEFEITLETAPEKTELVLIPEQTKLEQIAKQYQKNYSDRIVLACVDGKLRELSKVVKAPGKISFLTMTDRDGKRTYRRSMTLLLQKAVENLWKDQVKIRVYYSLGESYYCELHGTANDAAAVQALRAEMQRLVEADLPIKKCSVKTEDAEQLFHDKGMKDKERLLHYRRSSRVNIYELDGHQDYYYGYMVPSTGYLGVFDLELYEDGFVLLFPNKKGDEVEPLHTSNKLYHTLKESRSWSRMLDVGTIGALNDAIASGRGEQIILLQEALMEERIGSLAAQIAAKKGIKFVMIAGPSSSGKTTFSHRLSIQLAAHGMKPHPIAVDNYFVNRVDSPRDENGNYNYEVLECLDVELFNQNMTDLLAGKTVEIPEYNFIKGEREYHGDYLTLGADDVLVIEGIHCLNEKLSYALPRKNKFKIYISALTQLNIDEHNRIPTTDGRLLRRIVRDARTRGASAQDTIRMWPSVRRGEEENIFPYQEDADVMFNSALVYELSVLKQYAEPVLFSVPRDSAEYVEAKRLLKFLDYFLGVSSEEIPNNSLIREFIGGSCFKV